MDTFGAASFFVAVVFLLLLVALLVVGMVRLNGPPKALVGAGLGLLILVRVLSPLVEGPLLGSVASESDFNEHLLLTLVSSAVTELLTFIGVGLLVFGAIRAATSTVNRPRAPVEPLAEPTHPEDPAGYSGDPAGSPGPAGPADFSEGGYPGGPRR